MGATDANDAEAAFSNYGPCVDILAPGVAVRSAMLGGGDELRSGTSMAAPHVAGAAARYLQSNPTAGPPQVAKFLTNTATADVVRLVAKPLGTPNRLLYIGSSQ